MTIVDSKHRKDFYDFVHHNPDPIPYYDRTHTIIKMDNVKADEYNSETGFLNIFLKTLPLHWYGLSTIRQRINSKEYYQYQLLCIGDKSYLLYKQGPSQLDLKLMYCRDIDSLDYGKDNKQQNLFKNTDFLKAVKQINQKNKFPVSLWSMERNSTTIEVNPSLIPYAKFGLKPEQVYQEIEMWLSNYNKDPDIETVGSDEVILQQKGFDKESFRKKKTNVEVKWNSQSSSK